MSDALKPPVWPYNQLANKVLRGKATAQEAAFGAWRPAAMAQGGEIKGGDRIQADPPPAIGTILAERGNRYGPFAGHASITQKLKQVLYDHASGAGVDLGSVHREAIDMIAHKLGRIVNGDPCYDDSWVDIAGYAQLVVDHLHGRQT